MAAGLDTFDTVNNILNDAADEAGLAAIADPYASTDPNYKKLRKALKSALRELSRRRAWNHLRLECVFTTVAGQQSYQLPRDFYRMIPQSGWVRTTRLPFAGPLSPQEWQYLAAIPVGITYSVLFRPQAGQLQLVPAQGLTPGGQIVAYEYLSTWAVKSAVVVGAQGWTPGFAVAEQDILVANGNTYYYITEGVTAATGNGPTTFGTALDGTAVCKCVSSQALFPNAFNFTSGADTILLDSQMMVKKTKLDYLGNRGFPTDVAADEFNTAWELAVQGDVTSARTLNITGGSAEVPLLGVGNIPLTGYGS